MNKKGCKNNFFLIVLFPTAFTNSKYSEFQLIRKAKEYRINSETLKLEEESKSFKDYFKQFFTFYVTSSVIGIILLLVFIMAFDTPGNMLNKRELSDYNARYDQLEQRFDSIKKLLHSSMLSSDNIYRDVLELDSLPGNFRFAGHGGTPDFFSIRNSQNELIKKIYNQVNILSSQLDIQENSFDTILSVALLREKKLKSTPGIQPVKPDSNIWLSSGFGTRKDPFTRRLKRHKGLDFSGPKGTKIFSTADGYVTLAKFSRNGYGNEVVIDHGFGYTTRYAHLNKILVQKGQKVSRGELIGLMGNTGRSTGTHLHYEVCFNKFHKNPIYYFNDNLTPNEYELIITKALTNNPKGWQSRSINLTHKR